MLEPSSLTTVYAEMAQLIGVDNTIRIYERFKGHQVSMPQRLYSTEYVEDYVKKTTMGKMQKNWRENSSIRKGGSDSF